MSDEQSRSDSPAESAIPPQILEAPSLAIPTKTQGDLVSTGAPQLGDAHGAFADFHQDYVSGYIKFADTKAAWTFTIAAVLLGYIFANNRLQKVMFLPGWTLPFVLLASTVILLAASATFSFFTISPRTAKPSEQAIFFGAVAKRKSAGLYIYDIATMDQTRLIEARLKHTYDISRVCAAKYGHLRWAFRFGITGLICMAALVLVV